MGQFTQDHIDSVVAACRENLDAITESLNLCFDGSWRIEIEEPRSWDSESPPEELNGPGLAVAIALGEAAILCLLPESLPLPEWYADAGETSQARMQTLAMEWSINMLPSDLQADAYIAVMSSVLWRDVTPLDASARPTLLELSVISSESDPSEEASADEGANQTDASPSRISLVFPVAKPAILAPFEGEPGAEKTPSAPTPAGGSDAAGLAGIGPQGRHVLRLPVTVSVRLAEKRVELGQLLALTPGSLIAFSKSCEEPLDLYVDGQLYCRGEAVKIGEKFGLKIDRVGVEPRGENRSA